MRTLLAALAAAAPLAVAAAPAPVLAPRLPSNHAGGETHCVACHSAESWGDVRFIHDRTGFPLVGRHLQVTCKGCHTTGFTAKLPMACIGCHRDVHAGSMGGRCTSCHDATSWRSNFGADAHRLTNFPLTGRHALIPCEQCHGDKRDRNFSRPTGACIACHRTDRTRAALVAIDHDAAGFGNDCRQCHNMWTFAGAGFPAHDTCFLITSGPHAGIRCLDCHTQLTSFTVTGACNTGTASCTRCHTHSLAVTTQQHANVPGFEYKDRKCYECHRFATVPAALRTMLKRSR